MPITGLIGTSPAPDAVQLADGRKIALAGLFVVSATAPSSDLAEQLGCALNEGPTGIYLDVDAIKETRLLVFLPPVTLPRQCPTRT